MAFKATHVCSIRAYADVMLRAQIPHSYIAFKHIWFWHNASLLTVHQLNNNYILITLVNLNYSEINVFALKRLNKFFLKAFVPHWVRVAFRGKGFRLRKFKNNLKLTLNFGHSHWARLAMNSTFFFFKKLRRQNYICIVKTFFKIKSFKKNIKNYKTLNMYTKRGLRLKKQYIRRRFGKISQVVSSLH